VNVELCQDITNLPDLSKYDLIISDLSFPKSNPGSTLRILSKIDKPVIINSGNCSRNLEFDSDFCYVSKDMNTKEAIMRVIDYAITNKVIKITKGRIFE
jgi:hypothetical protein